MTRISPRTACIQSAVARHMRGWPDLPHIWVQPTPQGHRVVWRDPDAPWFSETVETRGVPGKSTFRVEDPVEDAPKRYWRPQERHPLQTADIHLEVYSTAGTEWTDALSSMDIEHGIRTLNRALSKSHVHEYVPELIQIQGFSRKGALSILWDALSIDELPIMYSRVALQHARERQHPVAWSFGHSIAPWNDMTLLAWENRQAGHAYSILVPRDRPIIYNQVQWDLDRDDRLHGPKMGCVGRAIDMYGRDIVEWQQWAESRMEVSTDAAWVEPMVSYVAGVRAGTIPALYELHRMESAWKLALRDYLQCSGLTNEQQRLRTMISLDDAFERGANENSFEQLSRWFNDLYPLEEAHTAFDLSTLSLD